MTKEELRDLYRQPDHVLTPDDYQCALDSQNAVNSIALINSLARMAGKIADEARAIQQGSLFRNSHPIIRLFLEQLCHLCGNDFNTRDSFVCSGLDIREHESSGMSYYTAYDICLEKTKGEQ